MTVKELKDKLEGFDDSMEIGGCGYFGECLEIYDVFTSEWRDFVILDMEEMGVHPE